MIGAGTVPAQYWSARNGVVECSLCPHRCRIPDGGFGRCSVRSSSGGAMVLPYFGHISSVGLDPIEKKPLYHFHPGELIYSVGFLGCNFHCPFCQNYSISQSTGRETIVLEPHEVVERARRAQSFGIAYTYNEPTIHYEFVAATADLARGAGLANVLVTNGHLLSDPAETLLERMDGVNVDLKSFNDQFYRRELGGQLAPVKDFIRIAARRCHVEVTTLLIPGKNDSSEELSAVSGFIASISPDIPLHISAYYPTYHYTYDGTTPDQVMRAVEIASEDLHYVYPGNIAGDANTWCRSCGALLIERRAYRIRTPGLNRNQCASCGATVPIVV